MKKTNGCEERSGLISARISRFQIQEDQRFRIYCYTELVHSNRRPKHSYHREKKVLACQNGPLLCFNVTFESRHNFLFHYLDIRILSSNGLQVYTESIHVNSHYHLGNLPRSTNRFLELTFKEVHDNNQGDLI